MKKSLVSLCCCMILMATACSKKEAGPAAGPGAAPQAGAAVHEGDSCEGISAMDGKAACDGAKSLACSSFTGYKYKMVQECPSGQTCVAAADGKSTTCK